MGNSSTLCHYLLGDCYTLCHYLISDSNMLCHHFIGDCSTLCCHLMGDCNTLTGNFEFYSCLKINSQIVLYCKGLLFQGFKISWIAKALREYVGLCFRGSTDNVIVCAVMISCG